jgi:hypothetical protein
MRLKYYKYKTRTNQRERPPGQCVSLWSLNIHHDISWSIALSTKWRLQPHKIFSAWQVQGINNYIIEAQLIDNEISDSFKYDNDEMSFCHKLDIISEK